MVLSDYLKEHGAPHSLAAEWSVVPVGGADAIPTFVALLGQHLDVTVLVDSRREGHQRLMRLATDGYLAKQRIVFVGEIAGQKNADIEDLFEVNEYFRYTTSFTLSVLRFTSAPEIAPVRTSSCHASPGISASIASTTAEPANDLCDITIKFVPWLSDGTLEQASDAVRPPESHH